MPRDTRDKSYVQYNVRTVAPAPKNCAAMWPSCTPCARRIIPPSAVVPEIALVTFVWGGDEKIEMVGGLG